MLKCSCILRNRVVHSDSWKPPNKNPPTHSYILCPAVNIGPPTVDWDGVNKTLILWFFAPWTPLAFVYPYKSILSVSFIHPHSSLCSLFPSSAAHFCTEGMAAVASIIHFPSAQVVFALRGAAGENREGEGRKIKNKEEWRMKSKWMETLNRKTEWK